MLCVDLDIMPINHFLLQSNVSPIMSFIRHATICINSIMPNNFHDSIVLLRNRRSLKSVVLLLAGSISDQSIQPTNVHTVRTDQANNPVYIVPIQPSGDGVVYEVMASEDVHAAPVLTAFTSDEGYSRLQRESSVFTQSTTSTTGDGHVDVEAFYGSLDNTEQYIVSSPIQHKYWCCLICVDHVHTYSTYIHTYIQT